MKIIPRTPNQTPNFIVKAWAKGETIPAGTFMLLDSLGSAQEYAERSTRYLKENNYLRWREAYKCSYSYWTIEVEEFNEWGEIAP